MYLPAGTWIVALWLWDTQTASLPVAGPRVNATGLAAGVNDPGVQPAEFTAWASPKVAPPFVLQALWEALWLAVAPAASRTAELKLSGTCVPPAARAGALPRCRP